MGMLEHLSDERGTVILGWIDARIMYARFERTISADVAARFGKRFMALIGDTAGVHYFADSSALVGYDLSAFPFVLDAMLAKREQFKLIVVLPWAGPIGKRAQMFADAFGCVEYVPTAAEFDSRLLAAAPHTPIRAVRSDQVAPADRRREPSEPIAIGYVPHWITKERPFDRRG